MLAQRVLSKDIEKYKAQLSLQAVEHEIRFGRLHEKVAETIAETYARLQRVSDCLRAFLNVQDSTTDPKREEYLRDLYEAFRDFETYFRPRRLFLPRETANHVWDAAKLMQAVQWQFAVPTSDARQINPEQARQALSKASREFQTRVRPLLDELEDEFRFLLAPRENRAG